MLPRVQRLQDRLIYFCRIVGVNLKVTSGFRSSAEQDALYAQGRTRPGNIVTNAKAGQSFHNYGAAFDVSIVKGGSLDFNITPFIGWIGKFCSLEWGGDWVDFKDVCHFQYTAGYSLSDFQNGKIDRSKFT